MLMSATINADFFAHYFGQLPAVTVAKVEVGGRSFPVEATFLEDVVETLKYTLPSDKQKKRPLPKDLPLLPGENKVLKNQGKTV